MYYDLDDMDNDLITVSKTELDNIKNKIKNIKLIDECENIVKDIENMKQYDETKIFICSLGIGICTIFGSSYGIFGAFIGCSVSCLTSFLIL
jgi:hypothetical protein